MVKIILLDIEGTTTPIDFVHKTLFPFARSRVAQYVAAEFDSLSDVIADLKTEHANDPDYTRVLDPRSSASVADYLKHLIDVDRKSTPLKTIQGRIWQQGYEEGELLSEVFDDVPRAFERWTSSGLAIAIYSSGSTLAQQLLFRYTSSGDLTKFIDHYLDTRIGGKRERESYLRIATSMGASSQTIMFVSDVEAELEAAHSAGLETALSVRPGNAPIAEPYPWKVVISFDDLPWSMQARSGPIPSEARDKFTI